MALTKNIVLDNGLEATASYGRVERLCLKSNTSLQFNINYYIDGVNRNVIISDFFSCPYDILGENPVKQAYDYAKTLPEFADSADV